MDIQELLDREAIRDCLYRYCRGADRADEAAMRATYWPDATDHHGAYSGSAEGFVAFALEVLRETEPGIHQIHNILIEFRPGGAQVESYFSAWGQLPDPNGFHWAHQKGRYVDWFEKRDGVWKIKARTVVFDWIENLPDLPGDRAERFGPKRSSGSHCPDDPVYTLYTG
jgi:hypothetical protein